MGRGLKELGLRSGDHIPGVHSEAHVDQRILGRDATDKRSSPVRLAAIAAQVDQLLDEGRTVVLVDSGGETRTRTVCRYLDLIEDTRGGTQPMPSGVALSEELASCRCIGLSNESFFGQAADCVETIARTGIR